MSLKNIKGTKAISILLAATGMVFLTFAPAFAGEVNTQQAAAQEIIIEESYIASSADEEASFEIVIEESYMAPTAG